MQYPTQFVREITLKGEEYQGKNACLRPARSGDIPAIESYIKRMPDDERQLRYFSSVPKDVLTNPKRLDQLYNRSLDYEGHMVFVVTHGEAVVGVAHAYGPCPEEDGYFEVSYSRDVQYRGAGVGTALMEGLILWGDKVGVQGFFADTLVINLRMRRLFERFGFGIIRPHPDGDHTLIRFQYSMNKK
ncbi:MAG: GNAT family N-acetyltransferase [Cyclobacteriaceae bacterium]|nr:MAG: GNAT family N-acetyltransferase [Cyclobacteriaceae bacterium]